MIRLLPVLLAVPSFAATISYTASTPGTFNGTPTNANTASTNWSQTLALPLFDSGLGTLTAVTLRLDGGVYGTARLESEDSSPASINYTLASQITASGISGLNVVVLPAANGVFNASSYDGTTDFGGTSGVTLSGLSNTAFSSTSSSLLAVLAAYTGGGTFNVSVNANGNSSSSGSGNVVSAFNTRAGALLTVTYDYDPLVPTPEPLSLAFVGAGLITVGLLRRK